MVESSSRVFSLHLAYVILASATEAHIFCLAWRKLMTWMGKCSLISGQKKLWTPAALLVFSCPSFSYLQHNQQKDLSIDTLQRLARTEQAILHYCFLQKVTVSRSMKHCFHRQSQAQKMSPCSIKDFLEIVLHLM